MAAVVCSSCGILPPKDKKFKHCSQCYVMSYCSVQCQKKDWENHKKFCEGIYTENKNNIKNYRNAVLDPENYKYISAFIYVISGLRERKDSVCIGNKIGDKYEFMISTELSFGPVKEERKGYFYLNFTSDDHIYTEFLFIPSEAAKESYNNLSQKEKRMMLMSRSIKIETIAGKSIFYSV